MTATWTLPVEVESDNEKSGDGIRINIKSSLVLLIIDSGIVTFLVCDNV